MSKQLYLCVKVEEKLVPLLVGMKSSTVCKYFGPFITNNSDLKPEHVQLIASRVTSDISNYDQCIKDTEEEIQLVITCNNNIAEKLATISGLQEKIRTYQEYIRQADAVLPLCELLEGASNLGTTFCLLWDDQFNNNSSTFNDMPREEG